MGEIDPPAVAQLAGNQCAGVFDQRSLIRSNTMFYGLICSAVVATGTWFMFASYRKPKPSKTLQKVEFEESLIDFTPKKGYLPMFERNQRLT